MKNRINIVMNEVYNVVKVEDNVEITKVDKSEITLEDKLSNTYPRQFKTLLGKVSCVENAITYIISNTMTLGDMRRGCGETKADMNKYLRKSHNVPYYNILEQMFIADSVLSSKVLVAEILDHEAFKDFENVDLVSVINIKSGIINTTEQYYKRKSYVRTLKKVIWEIKNTFAEYEKWARVGGYLEEDEDLSATAIADLNNEDYKKFKNSVKEKLVKALSDRLDENTNILEGVRGTTETPLEEVFNLWMK